MDQREALNQAALIDESGRWAAFKEKLIGLAQAGVQDPWKLEVIDGLAATTFAEAQRLANMASDRDSTPVIAWTARNLLELKVWSSYSAKSDSNMRRIFEDAGRDMMELSKKSAAEIGSRVTDDATPEHISTGQTELRERAAREGIVDLDSKFMPVASAAEEIGFAANFAHFNKYLSKFADVAPAI